MIFTNSLNPILYSSGRNGNNKYCETLLKGVPFQTLIVIVIGACLLAKDFICHYVTYKFINVPGICLPTNWRMVDRGKYSTKKINFPTFLIIKMIQDKNTPAIFISYLLKLYYNLLVRRMVKVPTTKVGIQFSLEMVILLLAGTTPVHSRWHKLMLISAILPSPAHPT